MNTQKAGSQFSPNVAALAEGGFVVSWDDWSSFDMKAQRFDASGQRLGGELLVNTATIGAQEYGDITGLTGGSFVATWRTTDTSGDGSGQAVKAQLFDASGAKSGAEFRVDSAVLGFQYSPSVTGLRDGGLVIAWFTTDAAQDGSSGAIKAQMFSASGAAIGAEFPFQRCSDRHPERARRHRAVRRRLRRRMGICRPIAGRFVLCHQGTELLGIGDEGRPRTARQHAGCRRADPTRSGGARRWAGGGHLGHIARSLRTDGAATTCWSRPTASARRYAA